MDYDKIIIDLLNRIVILEEKVSKLESRLLPNQNNNTELPSGSKKYRFLSDYLQQCNQMQIKLSYAEIENILNFKLPTSASTHRAFWANTTSHSIALSWLSVNYEVVKVNLEEQFVIFEKKRSFEKMKHNKSTATTEENHLNDCKNFEMINLYTKLKSATFEGLEGVTTAATADYISWSIDGGRQFANFYIQKKKIRILTLEPIKKHNLGESVPDTHLWTLNYQTDIFNENDIEEARKIICESYSKVNY